MVFPTVHLLRAASPNVGCLSRKSYLQSCSLVITYPYDFNSGDTEITRVFYCSSAG